MVFSTSNTKYY